MYNSIIRFNKRYQKKDYYGTNPSSLIDFARPYINKYISHTNKPSYKILDVGGGQGRDSIVLAKMVPNAHVYMLDLSEVGIKIANENFKNLGLENRVSADTQDIFEKYFDKFNNADIVSACMSLIFHTDTEKISELADETYSAFNNISNALTDGGLFLFSVYSDNDPMYRIGKPLDNQEEFRLMPDGRIRHFFTKKFINELLNRNDFELIAIANCKEEYDPNMKGRMFDIYNVVGNKITK